MAELDPKVWLKRSAWIAFGILLATLGYYALRPSAVPVDVAEIARGSLIVTINEEGKTRIKQVFVVSAPITGRVLRSELEVGDAVEHGRTTVAAMVPSPPPFLDVRSQSELTAQIEAARSAVELAEAEVVQMRAELEFAEKEYERTRALSVRDIVADRALEKARMDVDTRRAARAKTEAGLKLRKRELESMIARSIGPGSSLVESHGNSCCVAVTAPAAGRILAIHKRSEQIVAQGTPLLEIGDPSALEIVVELLSADAVRVKIGARATVTAWGGSGALSARVSRVEPAGFTKVSALGIEEQRVRVILDFDQATKDEAVRRLGHDYRVFVQIKVDEVENAVLVPLGALFRSENRWATYVMADGRARQRSLEIGHRNHEMAQVTSGLEPSEQIILHPNDRIADGVRVRQREQLH